MKSVETAFRRKGDPEPARVEVAPLLRAAEAAFPRWVRAQTYLRNAVEKDGDSAEHVMREHVRASRRALLAGLPLGGGADTL
ncbi:hypothetical protein ACIBLA_21620 [Streptomyces sp. NPDC050433]|uniref:hypothetical protein n=1 Tax=Streptomyces sp. NPDC050433 TaxID=3365615 RepID=UPI0037BBC5F6